MAAEGGGSAAPLGRGKAVETLRTGGSGRRKLGGGRRRTDGGTGWRRIGGGERRRSGNGRPRATGRQHGGCSPRPRRWAAFRPVGPRWWAAFGPRWWAAESLACSGRLNGLPSPVAPAETPLATLDTMCLHLAAERVYGLADASDEAGPGSEYHRRVGLDLYL